MKKTVLRNYARLIASKGVNVQKNKEVFIAAEIGQPEFVKMLAEECYRLGAKKVVVDFSCEAITKLDYRYRSLKNLCRLDDYEEAKWKHYAESFPCRIYLESEDPDGMKGIKPEKIAEVRQKTRAQVKSYRDRMENNYPWCIAAVPGEKWAKKLFPDCTKRQAEEKLWEAILKASRADADPIAAWEAHNADLRSKCESLNALGIESLHYHSANGTDFTVGMIPEAIFKGGADSTRDGIVFNPNIPSEECYISPMRGKAEGVVVSTKPLSYAGQLIENFSIRFENGKAVSWHAEKNEELLGKIITADESSAYLGEVALVPFDSPIQNTGLLFYSTLFDENASCHLALGSGFADSIRDFENRSLEECRALGINDSLIHVDFMIGSSDLSIEATTRDGRKVMIFRDGNWAI